MRNTSLGGSNYDVAHALSVTTEGVYVAGGTTSTDFPGTSVGAQPTMGGEGDTFVARLSHDPDTLHQVTYLVGSGFSEQGNALAVTGDGVYVVGFTSATDFPGTVGGAQPTTGGDYDAFVAHLSHDLQTPHQASYLGGVLTPLATPYRSPRTGSMSQEKPIPLTSPAPAAGRRRRSTGLPTPSSPVSTTPSLRPWRQESSLHRSFLRVVRCRLALQRQCLPPSSTRAVK